MNLPFEALHLDPNSQSPQTEIVGFYAMPIDGNPQNTGDRLQTMVDILGIPFVASDLLLQKKKIIIDLKAKTANQPSGKNYEELSLRRADFVADELNRYGLHTWLGMGDSLGVSAIQGIQLHAPTDQKFNALLLRDGWNLGEPTTVLRGISRYFRSWARDEIQKRRNGTQFVISEYGYSKAKSQVPNETNILQKIFNVSDMMRGPENAKNAIKLAAFGQVAMNIVCFDNGLSGTKTEADEFVKQLLYVGSGPRIKAQVVPGWHSDLLDPARGAADVKDTLQLL